MTRLLTAFLCLCMAPMAWAHPHIFVDTQLRIHVDADGLAHKVEMTWHYDDFFTLLILEDEGLDPDADGLLTPEEEARLKGFDLEVWPEGFEGDLYVFSGDRKLDLPRPEPVSATVENGRIVSTQTRDIPPSPIADLTIRQYDPTYYVAYTVREVVVFFADCQTEIAAPDLAAADAAVKKELDTMPEDMFEIMKPGAHYAQTIRFQCA
ncbi:DUF1007 family protein [Aestuariicoccus sp. MJ-SS9]|uniref:DUF1007 family protein n=1 Tax=Aestuariicoccus sp. MJ-SS9 TaxID=3079855 RepID=UPI002911A82C|nr:DUF1007 family protein [Aestuariicoccus sp. MJ-SS9]MDU8912016.1 DUF1007 family protein [Aestuariicoccus sp. MJ-SS9]